jgi:hypothetical protein
VRKIREESEGRSNFVFGKRKAWVAWGTGWSGQRKGEWWFE